MPITRGRVTVLAAPIFLSFLLSFALFRVALNAVPALPTYSASQLQFTYTQQGRISESEVADFNCDNRPDVILSNGLFQSGQAWPVTIALSNGSGGYVNGTSTIFTGAVGSSEHLGKMLIEDYNNDGRPDVFVADSGIDGFPFTGRQNHLYLSTADCHLIDASTTHLPQQSDFTHSATVADIDSDGDVDVYVGNIYGANQIPPQIWLNDGTAHFSVASGLLPAAQADLNQARYTSSLFVDVNNDGHPDLVLADDQNHNQSVVLVNDGTGHFTNVPGAITARPFGTNGVPLDVKSTDFDHDGFADVAIEFSKFNPYYQGRWIQLLRNNNGNGTFTDETATRLFPTQVDNFLTWLLFVHFVDIDGDGNNDLIGQMVGTNTDNHRFYLANGSGVFTENAFLAGQLGDVFALVDARGDGHRDVVDTRNIGNDQHTVSVLSNNSAVVTPGVPQRVRATRNLPGHVRLFWQYDWGATSYEVWRSATPGAIGTLVGTVSTTSFDDVNATGTAYYSVRGLNSAGASNFAAQARGSVYGGATPGLPTYGTSQPKFVLNQPGRIEMSVAADFNCDARVDVAFVRSVNGAMADPAVNIVVSDGLGGFSDGTTQIITGTAPVVYLPRKMLVEDFNGDGRPDIFIAVVGPGNPYPGYQNKLLLSTPDCHLVDATPNVPQQGDNTNSAAAADIDSDGDVDLYIGNVWGGNLIPPQVWLNNGAGQFSIGAGRLPAAQTNLDLNKYTASLLLDVDADGDADLVLGGDSDFNTLSTVLLNNGAGVFTVLPGSMPAKPFGVDALALDLKSADINHDDRPDLVAVYTRGGGSYGQGRWEQILINNGTGIFADETASRLPQVNNTTQWDIFAHWVDLDGDGNHDLIAQALDFNNGHRFFKASQAGVFSSIAFLSGSLADVFSLIDAKGDGHRDVLNIGYSGFNMNQISLLPDIGPVRPPGIPLGVRATSGLAGHIRLFWPYVWGATSYEVWRSAVAGNLGQFVGTTNSTSFDDVTVSDTAYYSVRAVNAGAVSAYAPQVRGVTTSVPLTFVKTAPANAATGQPLAVSLSWGVRSGATEYQYCLDTNNNSVCDSSWVSTGLSTSVSPAGLTGATTYYWHVRSLGPGGTVYAHGNAALFWSFSTIVPPPGAFAHVSPSNGAVGQPLNPTLSWGASSGATSYEYCVDTINNNLCDTVWNANGTNTSVGLSGLTAATSYFWHVRALNAGGTTYADASATAFWTLVTTRRSPLVDLNGDGNGDAFLYDPTSGYWSRQISQGGGGFGQQSESAWSPNWTVFRADFNADALTDVFLHNASSGLWFKLLNDGTGYTTEASGYWWPGWQKFVLDLNGDGLSDLFLYDPTTGQWYKALSFPGGFAYATGYWTPGWEITPVNLNGDAFDDLFLIDRTTGQWYWVYGEAGPAFTYPQVGYWAPDWVLYPGDFNGDGKGDLFLYRPNAGQYYVALNNGAGYNYTAGYGWAAGWTPYVGDFDGDGKDDLFLYSASSGVWFEMISDGSGGFTVGGNQTWTTGWQLYRTDVNGDGRTDILLYDPISGFWYQARNLVTGSFSYSSGFWAPGLQIFTRTPIR